MVAAVEDVVRLVAVVDLAVDEEALTSVAVVEGWELVADKSTYWYVTPLTE